MEKYLQIIQQVVPSVSKEELEISPQDAGIDSIDLIAVRVALEKYIGSEIPNLEWNNFKTIREAIDFCERNENSKTMATARFEPILATRMREINMPQMANSALSENWLFKELGDIHWELLFKGLNTNSSSIKDELGNRLYATFTRIQINSIALTGTKENSTLEFKAELKRFGHSTYISDIEIQSRETKSKATLMTSFSTREAIDNSKLFKSQPISTDNSVPEFSSAPDILNDYRLFRKGLLGSYKLSSESFDLTAKPIAEIKYRINPFYEINGVGLLYFASYPTISDKCEADYFNSTSNEKWENKFFTTDRDVFYFANCNAADSILYRLNHYELLNDGRVKIFSSLYRSSDMTLMAHIFTLKHP
jgi:probable biosynthetic protein (TIGR04098 family)